MNIREEIMLMANTPKADGTYMDYYTARTVVEGVIPHPDASYSTKRIFECELAKTRPEGEE